MSEPKSIGELTKDQFAKIKTEMELKATRAITKEDLIILLKAAYYGGWMDGNKDVHGNADTCVNSILK